MHGSGAHSDGKGPRVRIDSSYTNHGAWRGTGGRLASDLTLLLDKLEIARAHVVGHSFGGQVVQEFSAAHPERVEALTVA